MTVRVPLLLHSLSDLRELWQPVLGAIGARLVTEIGAETGATTRLIAGLLAQADGGTVFCVDPAADGLAAAPWVSEISLRGVAVQPVPGFSPEALTGLPGADVYFVDGDHNYWTVTGELGAIEGAAPGGLLPVVLMNDVSWPCARRDFYYSPGRLPPEAVHAHTWDHGVVPWSEEPLLGAGFRGEGEFAVAVREGGPGNGVLTAVEDFVAERPHARLLVIPSVFGLGVLYDTRRPYAQAIESILAPYTGSSYLRRLEENRVELYLRVIQLQDDLAVSRRETRVALTLLEQARAAEGARRVAELDQSSD